MVVEGPMRFALGTAQWGMDYGIANPTGAPERDEIEEILRIAKRAGIDTLDTARTYGEGETLIGALTEGDDHWKIVTKLDPAVGAPELDLREALRRTDQSVASSCAALRRDRLDVVLLHRAEHRTAWGGAIWQRLCEKRAAGEIGALGASVTTPGEAWALLEDSSVDSLQVAASLLDQRLAVAGFFERSRELGVQVDVRSVFLQGVAHLESNRLPAQLAGLDEPLKRLAEWAHARELRPSDAFLLYARDLLGARPVLGCESSGQLCQNLIAWRSLEVTREDLEELAAGVGEIEDRLLNPARWNESVPGFPERTPR